MVLPILNAPTFDVKVPSTGKTIKCRTLCVKENKLLLMALEANDEKETVNALKQIFKNCIIEPRGHKIDNLAVFDFEYIFLKIRSKSKGEIVTLKYNGIENSECEECKKPKIVNINLSSIEVKKNPEHSLKIQLTDDVGVKMKYPQFNIFEKISNTVESVELYFDLIKNCIECIYDGSDQVYDVKDIPVEEFDTFLDSLTAEQFEKIIKFFETMPVIEYEIDLGCKTCGREDKQVIRGLQNFFQ